MVIVDWVHTTACVSHSSLFCFVLCNVDFILYVIFILHQKSYLLMPYFRMPYPLHFTHRLFCMLVYTMYNRFNGYLQCTVSYAPCYVCIERSAMTSIKYFKVQSLIKRSHIAPWFNFLIYSFFSFWRKLLNSKVIFSLAPVNVKDKPIENPWLKPFKYWDFCLPYPCNNLCNSSTLIKGISISSLCAFEAPWWFVARLSWGLGAWGVCV